MTKTETNPTIQAIHAVSNAVKAHRKNFDVNTEPRKLFAEVTRAEVIAGQWNAENTEFSQDKLAVYCEEPVTETRFETTGDLYRFCVREYGRCTGKVRVDRKNGAPMVIGWVFRKLEKYEDTGKPFLSETWVTVHESKPELKKTVFYKQLKA